MRYEVGLFILMGEIVWLNRYCKAGMWNNIQIFQNFLLNHLEEQELVEADDGYVDKAPNHVKCYNSFVNPEETLFMK